MTQAVSKDIANEKAYIVTGPTSGIGRATALELAKHGTVILVGRNPMKLEEIQTIIRQKGQHAVSVVCDLSDMASVQRAAAEIVALQLPVVGLLNNAGLHETRATKSAQGWDTTFATNHLGPFMLTEALIPHLPDGADVVFVASGAEDPERRPAQMAGFRGGRYLSAEASAHGEWLPGGSTQPGSDAYATSKQSILAAAIEFARENPRSHVNAVEPGFSPDTALGRDANIFVRFLLKYVLTLFAPFVRYWSTSRRAAQIITKVLTSESGATGVYYDERGQPMLASERVRDPEFRARVVTETRALLIGKSRKSQSEMLIEQKRAEERGVQHS